MEEEKNLEGIMDQMIERADEYDDTSVVEMRPETDGPSKGFVALVVGGIAAVAVGVAVVMKRHKKKKAETQTAVEDYDDYEDFADTYDEDLDPAEKAETSEDKKSAKKKG